MTLIIAVKTWALRHLSSDMDKFKKKKMGRKQSEVYFLQKAKHCPKKLQKNVMNSINVV